MADEGGSNSLAHRLLWFAGLWIGGVLVVALVAYGLRWVIIGG